MSRIEWIKKIIIIVAGSIVAAYDEIHKQILETVNSFYEKEP